MTETVERFRVEPREEARRLDELLARRLPTVTRSQAEKLAHAGKVLLNGRSARPGERVKAGDQVQVSLPAAGGGLAPHAIALDIVHEDEHLLIVNKPPGLAVHPGAGRTQHTLVNALIAYTALPEGHGPLRPGLVHRLDRFTSGLLVVAKSDQALDLLSRQVRERELERRHLALVWGVVREDRLLIDVPVKRLVQDPTRVVPALGPARERAALATTDVRTLDRYPNLSLLEAKLLTGRTHQIRVHLNYVGHPVVGDPVYGIRRARQEKRALDSKTLALVKALPGQALHAHALAFRHPISGQELSFSVPPPAAMARLLAHLGRAVV